MNRRYGMSADATLKAAQSLYESKLISYPRTDSRHLSRDLKPKMPGILSELRKQWPTEVGRLDLSPLDRRRPDLRRRQGCRPPRHHPHRQGPGRPRPGTQEGLRRHRPPPDRRLLPACVREVTTVLGEVEPSVPFRAKGVRVVEPGWTVLDPRKPIAASPRTSQDLPEFVVGETGPHDADGPPRRDLAPQAVHRGELARRDGDGRQAGRRRGPPRGPQGARAWGRRRPGRR